MTKFPVADLTQDPGPEPRCTEVEITASSGGKVQVVKFSLQNEFGFAYTEKYTIPDNWPPERLEEWTTTKTQEIKNKVDAFAQVEQDALLADSDWYDGKTS